MELKNGDYCPDGQGAFRRLSGGEAVLQRVLFRLTTRRGGYCLRPDMGSRLYLLPRAKSKDKGELAKSFVEEALAKEENLTLEAVDWQESDSSLTVSLLWQGEPLRLSLRL